MLRRLRQQTYVGGKRVDIQELPRLPKGAATTVRRVKVSLYGGKPPVWRRLEIPSAMTLQIFDGGGYRLFWRPSVDLSQMLPAEAWARPQQGDPLTARKCPSFSSVAIAPPLSLAHGGPGSSPSWR